jgi:hypothetical protein
VAAYIARESLHILITQGKMRYLYTTNLNKTEPTKNNDTPTRTQRRLFALHHCQHWPIQNVKNDYQQQRKLRGGS